MSNKIAVKVKTALVKVFNKSHGRFMAAAEKSAAEGVKAINESRILGITLKELIGRENVTENCLREWLRAQRAAGPKCQLAETEVAWLMNFVRVSNKMQDELRLFGDAPLDVRQMTFQCAGLLPAEASRELAQTSHELTPSAQAWKCFMDVRVKFDGVVKNHSLWDPETRSEVKQSIDKTRRYLDEIEAKL